MFKNFPSLFIALRYLKPSKNNTMVSIISLFSFLGIVLGVGTLIIVMSVMNGFKIELLDKIIGINGHLNIHFYENKSNENKFESFLNSNNDVKAFSILGVSVGLKWEKIQDKFKTLVKKFHPDMNSGNKKYEEKLKLITLAYTQLKNTYREKIDT